MKFKTVWPQPRPPRVLKTTSKYRIVELELPIYSMITKGGMNEQTGWSRKLVIEERGTDALGNDKWVTVLEDRSSRHPMCSMYMDHTTKDLLFDLLLEIL